MGNEKARIHYQSEVTIKVRFVYTLGGIFKIRKEVPNQKA